MSSPFAASVPIALHSSPPRGLDPVSPESALEELHARISSHSFWNNRLLRACRRGVLTREDFGFVFSQYALVVRSGARFVHALLSQCDSELWCTRLTQGLWEESSAPPLEKRPAALFRRFLREGLGVEEESIRFHDATRYFVRECLDACLRAPPAAACAFLALGLEAPLPRLYSVFIDGLLQTGLCERHLPFFQRKMGDGAWASLLEEWLRAHAGEPGWFELSAQALERALKLQEHFFEGLFEALQQHRLRPLVERLQARPPQGSEGPEPRGVHVSSESPLIPFYRHAHEQRGIDCTVERLPFCPEVLEATRVRVEPGRGSEPREHAYEVLFTVLSGTGRVRVRGTEVAVKPGDAVFVPRWAPYQAHATGPEPLLLLTVTDHGFTRRAHEEELLRAARLKSATGVDL